MTKMIETRQSKEFPGLTLKIEEKEMTKKSKFKVGDTYTVKYYVITFTWDKYEVIYHIVDAKWAKQYAIEVDSYTPSPYGDSNYNENLISHIDKVAQAYYKKLMT